MQYGKFGLAARLAAAVLALGVVHGAAAADPDKKEIRFGATAGPYADQIRYGVKPVLSSAATRSPSSNSATTCSPTWRWPTAPSTPTPSSTWPT